MEKKSWSWKKKVIERLASPRGSTEPPLVEEFSIQSADDLLKLQVASKEQLNMLDGMGQAEVKLRILSEQLMARDYLVQQHAKVAEEAVAGWEKAECEAACLKQQLDEELVHKASVEEQLIQVRKVSEDSKGKLIPTEESENRLKQLSEMKEQEIKTLRNETQAAMSKVVSEMARAVKEAEARNRAEEKANLLQKRVEMVEKDQSNLKYELIVLSKELDIRNKELELNKQLQENAAREYLNNVKITEKLEDDCHRLRYLLQKRPTCPSSSIPIQIESENRQFDRISHVMVPSSRFGDLCVESAISDALQELESRIMLVEEEKGCLKETLAKKDAELHSARLLCAKMATKLSAVDEQLERVMPSRAHVKFHRSTKSAIDGFTSSLPDESFLMGLENEPAEVDNNSAESWASALIKELAHIKRDKLINSTNSSLGLLGSDLMDDFVEMEKLAFLSQEKGPGEESESCRQLKQINGQDESRVPDFHMLNPQKNSSQEVKSKLIALENELNVVKAENLATKAALSSIEKHLVAILQAETEERASTIDIFEEVRAALDSMYKNLTHWNGPLYAFSSGADSPEIRDATAWSPMGQSSCLSEDAKFSPKKANNGQKLRSAVHKVVVLFEELAQSDWKQCNSLDANDILTRIHVGKLWKTSEFESCARSLILLCNGVLDEKVDVNDFLEEIASALEWLVNHVYSPSEKRLNTQRRLEFSMPAHESSGKQSLPEDLCTIDDDSVRIEKQLIQLKNEKEDIDIKLNVMTKELERLKAVLQGSEGNPDKEARQPVMNVRYKYEDIEGPESCEDIGSDKLDKYQLHSWTVNGKSTPVNRYQNIVFPSGSFSPSLLRVQETLATAMVSGSEAAHITYPEDSNRSDQNQELSGCGEKLVECQQEIVLLGKQLQALGMPGHASEILLKAEHVSGKNGKAHRRAQRSVDHLHTIHEDSATCEEAKVAPINCDKSPSVYAVGSPERQNDFCSESTGSSTSGRSAAKLMKGKSDLKQDSNNEKQVKGLSRFFSKSKIFNETTQ